MPSLLSVQHVSRAFGGLQAVRDVSLQVDEGEILGIIGPNGAGKSTLFGMIAGQIAPDRGQVALDGQRLDGRMPEDIVRLGLVKTFQTSRPFSSMTFLENVTLGALSRGASLVRARAGAYDHLATVGLAEHATAPARGASTGQRKRLEIARALATQPRILLLDEPFGGVDIAAIDSLIGLLQRIRMAGITLLVIEHNLEALQRLVDRVIALDLGAVIAEGTPASVLSDQRVLDAYMGGSEVRHA